MPDSSEDSSAQAQNEPAPRRNITELGHLLLPLNVRSLALSGIFLLMFFTP
jgi:hypothetical protein